MSSRAQFKLWSSSAKQVMVVQKKKSSLRSSDAECIEYDCSRVELTSNSGKYREKGVNVNSPSLALLHPVPTHIRLFTNANLSSPVSNSIETRYLYVLGLTVSATLGSCTFSRISFAPVSQPFMRTMMKAGGSSVVWKMYVALTEVDRSFVTV